MVSEVSSIAHLTLNPLQSCLKVYGHGSRVYTGAHGPHIAHGDRLYPL